MGCYCHADALNKKQHLLSPSTIAGAELIASCTLHAVHCMLCFACCALHAVGWVPVFAGCAVRNVLAWFETMALQVIPIRKLAGDKCRPGHFCPCYADAYLRMHGCLVCLSEICLLHDSLYTDIPEAVLTRERSLHQSH